MSQDVQGLKKAGDKVLSATMSDIKMDYGEDRYVKQTWDFYEEAFHVYVKPEINIDLF